jgi:hypothetical protein
VGESAKITPAENHHSRLVWWHTPVILQEAEARRSKVQNQPGLYNETLSQKQSKGKKYHSIISGCEPFG